MSRDYKKPAYTAKEQKGNPLVTGLIIGVLIGLLLAAGTALLFTDLLAPFGKKKAAAAPAEAVTATSAADTTKPDAPPQPSAKTKFDFYTILPSDKAVNLPNDKASAAPAGQAAANAAPGDNSTATPAAPAPAASPAAADNSPQQYYLQAGAFRSDAEADNLKANLALMGVEASIQAVHLPDNTILHRVRLGPYSTLDKTNKARDALTANGINTTIVRAGGN